jgi:hypothetical protein
MKWQPDYGVVGHRLPPSREGTIRLKCITQQMIMVGTPLECCVKCFDNKATEFSYKYPWWQRVLYTSWAGRHLFKAPDGKLQS